MRRFFVPAVLTTLAACAGEGQSAPLPGAAASAPLAAAHAPPGSLCLDTAASRIRWRGTKRLPRGEHRGEVRFAAGSLALDGRADAQGHLVVDMRTISVTDIPPHETTARRNLVDHLTHEEFFAVDRFPVARFDLTAARPRGAGTYDVDGTLAIRDSVHPIQFVATASTITSDELVASARVVFDRYRWGVAFDGATSMLRNALVNAEVELDVDLVARRGACPGAVARQREPVIGGPCEGCEAIFEGLPAEPAATTRLAPPDEPGEPMRVEGVVFDRDGHPAAGIIVYAYQTDARGVYPPMARPPGAAAARHGRLRGWARTDAAGRYRFDTVRPGGYPGRPDPQHVHLHVLEPGCCTYYIDSVVFTDDPRLTPVARAREAAGRGGSGVVTPTRDAAGTWRAQRDIHLRQGLGG